MDTYADRTPLATSDTEVALLRNGRRESRLSGCWRVLKGASHRAPVSPQDTIAENVDESSFSYFQMLGEGKFGTVYLVKHNHRSMTHAMKVLRKSNGRNGSAWSIGRQWTEFLAVASTENGFAQQPYIVTLDYAFQTAKELVLVMQFCPGGNLKQRIANAVNNRLHEPLARQYAAEVLLALEYLHERQIVYRTVRPDNVMLDKDSHCLLTVPTWSRSFVGARTCTYQTCHPAALHNHPDMPYMAPEVLHERQAEDIRDITSITVHIAREGDALNASFADLAGEVACPPHHFNIGDKIAELYAYMSLQLGRASVKFYDRSNGVPQDSDIASYDTLTAAVGHSWSNLTGNLWSIGVLLFVMLTGRPPFYDESRHRSREHLLSTLMRDTALDFNPHPYVSVNAVSAIRSLRQSDPSRRLGSRSTVDVKQHIFFATIDFDALLKREVPVPQLAAPLEGCAEVASDAADAGLIPTTKNWCRYGPFEKGLQVRMRRFWLVG